MLEEYQSELYDLKLKQEGKRSAISDEVEILLTGEFFLSGRYLRYVMHCVADLDPDRLPGSGSS